MTDAPAALAHVRQRMSSTALRYGRDPTTITLLAVGKQQSPESIRQLHAHGQVDFGENYVQEALPKQAALADLPLCWHFIGRIQRNKTRDIATHFDWVHTLDRLEVAERLSAQRPPGRGPLNCLIEVNTSGEARKGGVPVAALGPLVIAILRLPGLALRGLMAMPAPVDGFERQRAGFRVLREARDQLAHPAVQLLSMGTSGDFEAAIAEDADIVRIGTALFGPRSQPGLAPPGATLAPGVQPRTSPHD